MPPKREVFMPIHIDIYTYTSGEGTCEYIRMITPHTYINTKHNSIHAFCPNTGAPNSQVQVDKYVDLHILAWHRWFL